LFLEENQEQGPGLDIELTEEIAEGIYSNFAIITHSQTEFIVDFVRMMPGIPKGKVKSRIILAPQHAKRLVMALSDNLVDMKIILEKSRWRKAMGCLPMRFLLASEVRQDRPNNYAIQV